MTAEERFQAAAGRAGERTGSGIGTLGEKTLHACLKYYLDPDKTHHEVRVGRYVADIADGKSVTEIQSRQFYRLQKKLAAFLERGPVTVAYPVAKRKWVNWVSPETGEIVSRRRSTRSGSAADVLPELYDLRAFLGRLHIHVLLLEVEEYRLLNGWGPEKKRGGARYERRPVALLGEVELPPGDNYARLLPPGHPESFTVKDFAKRCRLSEARARAALGVLTRTGAVLRTGKHGRALVYAHGNALKVEALDKLLPGAAVREDEGPREEQR